MHFIFLIDQIYRQGGAEKVLIQKANYLVEQLNYQVTILTTEQNSNSPYFQLNANVAVVDLEVNYERDKSFISCSNLLKVPKHFIELKKALKNLKPDIVILVNFTFDFYTLPFILQKVPKWKEYHSSRYFEYQKRIDNTSKLANIKYYLNDWIESKYDRIIVLNPDEQNYYSSANISVVPNSIDMREETALLTKKQVIAAGRIAPVKNFQDLIEAWKIIYERYPDWQLHIYGDSYLDTKDILKQKVHENKLENVVIFKESVNDLASTMVDYSIYAMSSLTECFPMVLLEALSVGLPIVSYDCPNGPRHIIQSPSDGLLVANQDPKALAKGLLELIANVDLRKKMGVIAKKNSSKFAASSIMHDWLGLSELKNKES